MILDRKSQENRLLKSLNKPLPEIFQGNPQKSDACSEKNKKPTHRVGNCFQNWCINIQWPCDPKECNPLQTKNTIKSNYYQENHFLSIPIQSISEKIKPLTPGSLNPQPLRCSGWGFSKKDFIKIHPPFIKCLVMFFHCLKYINICGVKFDIVSNLFSGNCAWGSNPHGRG